ncbi:sorting nexin-33-like [Branchiostoma floridae x Branchiostoma japonicum]
MSGSADQKNKRAVLRPVADMGEEKVRVLYDFEGVAENGELTIYTDEILTIVRKDVGEGWWEGQNDRGESGYFPSAYVEDSGSGGAVTDTPPTTDSSYYNGSQDTSATTYTPESASATDQWNDPSSQYQNTAATDPWDQGVANTAYSSSYGQDSWGDTATAQAGGQDEGWDDDWDDDGASTGSSTATTPTSPTTKTMSNDASKSGGTMRKSLNRFSMFVKSGGEAFILGTTKSAGSTKNRVCVTETQEGGWSWGPNPAPYKVTVADPKKDSKLKGLKSFITYQLTPDNTNQTVSRRYKHFDWLYERLIEKFTTIAVPPLPEKQVTGRYEENFVEGRRQQLQLWVDRMSCHPVVAQSEVFQFFLQSPSDKTWKDGKRRAEKDPLVGGAFFHTVEAPQARLEAARIDTNMENFNKFQKSMDDSVKNLLAVAAESTKKHMGGFKREYQRVGEAFTKLGTTFDLDKKPSSKPLTTALWKTGAAYFEIGKMFEEQPQHDLNALMLKVDEYKGILSTFPDILQSMKGTMTKVRDCQRMVVEGKMSGDELEEVGARADVITYTTLAEIQHFHEMRVVDFKAIAQHFLTEQIEFYGKIKATLEESLKNYENV